jgi:enoyl-CoA hydratase/carnithine racemase
MRMLSSGSDEVLVNVKNQAAIITLNRPKALNALNIPMVEQIYKVLKVRFLKSFHFKFPF